MKQLKGLDLKRARLVPSSVFASPEEVIRAPGLSRAQKLAILRRWEFDARSVSGSARASRASSGDSTMLFQVQRALDELAGKPVEQIRSGLTALAARDDARPVYAPAPPEAAESPCAPPGFVAYRDRRSFSRF